MDINIWACHNSSWQVCNNFLNMHAILVFFQDIIETQNIYVSFHFSDHQGQQIAVWHSTSLLIKENLAFRCGGCRILDEFPRRNRELIILTMNVLLTQLLKLETHYIYIYVKYIHTCILILAMTNSIFYTYNLQLTSYFIKRNTIHSLCQIIDLIIIHIIDKS